MCKWLVLNWKNVSNFHKLEVVDRGSETQLQVGEKIKLFIVALYGLKMSVCCNTTIGCTFIIITDV